MNPSSTGQPLGPEGQPCAECQAPLAADQRYCLNCGHRRTGPRVDFMALGAGQTPAQPAPAPAPAPPQPVERDTSPLLAVAGIGLLGVMLLVGVLIGRDDNPEPAPAPVVQVAEPTETASSGGDGGSETGAKSNASDRGSKDGSQSGDKNGGGDGGGGIEEEPVETSTEELEALESSSGQDYSDASEDLPDTIETPGEAPPTDNREPGGGSSATTIK